MLSLTAAAAMMGARLIGRPDAGDVTFDRVNTDSRSIQAGDLFFAIAGEHFDGHHFAGAALRDGAVAIVASRALADAPGPVLLVADTRAALAHLAIGWRRRFNPPLVAITGSNGKTTVKEMLASILAAEYGEAGRLATERNLNNDLGVPLTALRLHARHRAAVIELGMNHPGEIIGLARIAQPTVALVNNAQREHQEFMASVDAVALENGAVLTSLVANGTAVFPAGTPYDALWRDLAGGRRCLSFVLHRDDGKSESIKAEINGTARVYAEGVMLTISGVVDCRSVRIATPGEHNAHNALAAAACAHAIGISDDTIARGLEAFTPASGRSQRRPHPSGAWLFDDSYNANPDSVRAAIDVLAARPAPRILVLGDMGEVGDQGPRFHEEIGAYAKARGIERLIAIGALMGHAADAFGAGAERATDVADAVRLIGPLSANSAVLIKGSRFMRMERLVAALLDDASNAGAH